MYPEAMTSPMVRGSGGRCAARPHLCEGLLEEKEEAAVGQSNLKTPQKPGCDVTKQTARFPALFSQRRTCQGVKALAVVQETLGRRQGQARAPKREKLTAEEEGSNVEKERA